MESQYLSNLKKDLKKQLKADPGINLVQAIIPMQLIRILINYMYL